MGYAVVVGVIALEVAGVEEVEEVPGVEEMGTFGPMAFSTEVVVMDTEGLEAAEAEADTQTEGMEDRRLRGKEMVYESRL